MARPHTTLRTLIALVLLGMLVGLFSSLGRWQLDRAAQRDAIKSAMEAGRKRAPIELSTGTPADRLAPWQAASAQGHWRHDLTVLLENRNYQGRPGYWVATPLVLDAPAANAASNATPHAVSDASPNVSSNAASTTAPNAPLNAVPNAVQHAAEDAATPSGQAARMDGAAALLVLRGWLPRPMRPGQERPGQARPVQDLPAIPQPQGLQVVQGELLERVPRMFELWSWSDDSATQLPARLPDPDRPLPSIQNLDLQAYSAATGLKFIPVVLAQTAKGGDSADADKNTDNQGMVLLRDWPEPLLDSDKNRGYALQWYGFAAIAAIAWLAVAWRALRRRRAHRSTP